MCMQKLKEPLSRNGTEGGGGGWGGSGSETRRGGALGMVRGLHNNSSNGGLGPGAGGGGATFVFQVCGGIKTNIKDAPLTFQI